tara:strand:- start:10961 stop:11488 length:528 start_codon:yes stop_codon:yes gene_type:complete
MPKIDDKFEKEITEASVNIRNENKSEDNTYINSKEDLVTYFRELENSAGINPQDSLWCPEFNECIGEVLEEGAKKYAPRDWEQPDGYSMGYKAQCDAIFHHLAREFVYKENQDLLEEIEFDIAKIRETKPREENFLQLVEELLKALKYDEIGTRHLQHVATRSAMSYTREKRGLK